MDNSNIRKDRAHDGAGFRQLELHDRLCSVLERLGFDSPTPIQREAIPLALAGKDLLGCAQTGTGKTAAYALPTLHRVLSTAPSSRALRALILAPTRELADQIGKSFIQYAGGRTPRVVVAYGGVSRHRQVNALRGGCDVLVATPGRLMDFLNDGVVSVSDLEVFVLDEADRMLDMGFVHDVRRVSSRLPASCQTLMFSATMPAAISKLAGEILRSPSTVTVDHDPSKQADIDQSVYFVEQPQKTSLLLHLLQDSGVRNAVVFTRTKHGADKLCRNLCRAGISANAIHGNKSQAARTRALGDFTAGRARVIVATDVASRGIDIERLSHVINFDVPHEPEAYVHRIGRTGRAGRSGVAWSFCGRQERAYLRSIERLTKKRVPELGLPEGLSFSALEVAPPGGRDGHKVSAHRGKRPSKGRFSRDRYRGDRPS